MTERIERNLFSFSIIHELLLGAGPEDGPEMDDQ